MVAPESLPAAYIVMAIPMTAGQALREHQAIDWSGVGWTSLGRVPGVFAGAALVSALDTRLLAVAIGFFVLLSVAMSLLAPPIPIRPGNAVGVGFASSLMGTASSIGGPPMGLLYQHAPGPVLRSTLGVTFLIGVALSLAALAWAGELAARHWALGFALMPTVGLGLWASRHTHGRLDAGWLRPAVLGFSAVAGAVVMIRGLV